MAVKSQCKLTTAKGYSDESDEAEFINEDEIDNGSDSSEYDS